MATRGGARRLLLFALALSRVSSQDPTAAPAAGPTWHKKGDPSKDCTARAEEQVAARESVRPSPGDSLSISPDREPVSEDSVPCRTGLRAKGSSRRRTSPRARAQARGSRTTPRIGAAGTRRPRA
mmetsp:Transcript_14309/g.42973  ORF Transcript_14309/g.42973 Transcript_14309/m.42973 type:complete len:125 (-) Transcript_14309:208-582(-)